MKAMYKAFRIMACAGFVLTSISVQGYDKAVNLLSPIAADGIHGFRFGQTAESMLGKPLFPTLDPGPHGEQTIRIGIIEPRFGFDSLLLGFTMESQRLCRLSLIRNFNYSESDLAILGMASNVCDWLKASFGVTVKVNAKFGLHSPSRALYASMETDTVELKLEASRRHDVPMAWLCLSMHDKRLVVEASEEYSRLSNDESVKAEVERRKRRFLYLLPLLYAIPLYAVCCLPVFIVLLVVYLVAMKARKGKPTGLLGWCDLIALVLSPYIWACMECVGQSKSLANVVEFAIIGWTWCLCLAVRYAMSIIGHRRFEKHYGIVTLLLVLSVAALLAVFFPPLPE